MGFLDNLENSLKSLESSEERDGSVHARREDDRARALAVAPWSEQLKNSDFTKQLFDKAAAAGHRIRAKVYMAWLENTLRLEAREKRLELRPMPDGIVVEFETPDGRHVTRALDLASDPDLLLDEWLTPKQPPSETK